MRKNYGSDIGNLIERLNKLEEKLSLYEQYERPLPATNEPFYKQYTRKQKFFARPLVQGPLYGYYPAYVVETRDPWKMNRVRVYIPQIHRYSKMTIDMFPWARPSLFAGSLDEQGFTGVPPEGSTIYVTFFMGNLEDPIWVGCQWNVTRNFKGDVDYVGKGSDNAGTLRFSEEDKRWNEERYSMLDHNPDVNDDPHQLFPPFNNESYNGPDLHVQAGSTDTSGVTYAATRPHIFAFKSPEKHFWQFVDGDSNNSLKGKRAVFQSSKGNVLFLKDDSMNHSDKIFENPMWDDFHDKYPNCMYKRAPQQGPYNQHDINLEHTGVWLQSVAGARLFFDDRCQFMPGGNKWYSGWSPSGKLYSKVMLECITEHSIELRDHETTINERDEQNGIFIHTATGNCIQGIDHTVDNIAGEQRGIKLWSTSNHLVELKDTGCKAVTQRKGRGHRVDWYVGQHNPTATRGHILLRSGWGQRILIADYFSQQVDDLQFILVMNRNLENHVNFIWMWCVANDKLFFVRAAGTMLVDVWHNYYRHNWWGTEFITIDTGNQITNIPKGADYRHSETIAYYWNTKVICLAVGTLIERGATSELQHPLYNVVVDRPCSRYTCKLTGHVHRDYATPYVKASGARCAEGGSGTGTDTHTSGVSNIQIE